MELSWIEENEFIENSQKFKKIVEYREMNKAANQTSTDEQFKDHPEYQYFI